MRKSTAAALIAILLVAVFARLLPLLSYVYWGSDTGEYHRLTESLVGSGHLGTEYAGWGKAYPYFPGFYFVVGGGGMMGVDDNTALNLIPPLLNAVAVLLVFLIAVRLFRDDRIGLIAAGVLAVAFPYVYTNSHPIPSAIGTLFFLASVALLLGSHQGMKRMVALVPLALAIVVTHHLSTYFLILAVLMALVVKSLLARNFRWSHVTIEASFLVLLLCLALPYWLIYAEAFRENLLGDLGAMPWWGPFAILASLCIAWLAVVRLRQRINWRYVPRYPTARRIGTILAIVMVSTFSIAFMFTLVDVIGTTIKLSVGVVAFVSPFLLLIAFAGPGRKSLDFARDGYKPTAWFVVFTMSMIAGSVIGERVLVPYRHIDFILIPLAILIGSGFVAVHDIAFASRKGGVLVGILAGALIAANIVVAYPPPDVLAGYNEGSSAQSLVAMGWLPSHAEGLLATDHKASMLAFGYGRTNATWDTARQTLYAPDFATAEPEMLNVNSPSGPGRVDYVLVNEDVRTGAQMFPWEPATGLSDMAQAKFADTPYQRFYDDGYTQVYWVNWGLS